MQNNRKSTANGLQLFQTENLQILCVQGKECGHVRHSACASFRPIHTRPGQASPDTQKQHPGLVSAKALTLLVIAARSHIEHEKRLQIQRWTAAKTS
jgi:hypothetical protein